jgi:hypothetical protein
LAKNELENNLEESRRGLVQTATNQRPGEKSKYFSEYKSTGLFFFPAVKHRGGYQKNIGIFIHTA